MFFIYEWYSSIEGSFPRIEVIAANSAEDK
jgi:hypothetical protein